MLSWMEVVAVFIEWGAIRIWPSPMMIFYLGRCFICVTKKDHHQEFSAHDNDAFLCMNLFLKYIWVSFLDQMKLSIFILFRGLQQHLEELWHKYLIESKQSAVWLSSVFFILTTESVWLLSWIVSTVLQKGLFHHSGLTS